MKKTNRGKAPHLIRNLNWNWAGIFIESFAAFWVCPYLILNLGVVNYGTWVMIGSLAGYFGLLDLGVKGSVGRHVALYREQDNKAAINEIASTACIILTVAGVLAFLTIGLISLFGSSLIESSLQTKEIIQCRWALLIAGLQLMFLLPLSVADGILWGCQRFDLLNKVRIPIVALRSVGSVLIVCWGGGLVQLAVLMLVSTVVLGITNLAFVRLVLPNLSLRPSFVSKKRFRELITFGTWNSIRSIASMLPTRLAPIIVGVAGGVALVAPLSIAARLVAVSSAIVVAASGVLTPYATTLHAKNAHADIQRLMVRGGRYCLAASIYFFTLFLLLGDTLINVWIGPEMEGAYQALVILAFGRCIGLSQMTNRGIVTAMAKHRALALVGIAQSLFTLVLGFIALQWFGLLGFVSIAAAGDLLCSGVFCLFYGCLVTEIPVREYLSRLYESGLKLLWPSILLGSLVVIRPAEDWLDIVCYGCAFTTTCVLLYPMAVDQINILSFLNRRRRVDAVSN